MKFTKIEDASNRIIDEKQERERGRELLDEAEKTREFLYIGGCEVEVIHLALTRECMILGKLFKT